MSIVIHVGLHKTGTTFLQEQIFKKLKNINYSKRIDLHRIHIDNNKINLISNAWLSSDEPHFYEFGATDKYEILSHIKKLFPDAKIILVKRNFSPWLKSCYRQYIVSGGILTFDDYCEKYNHNFIDMDDYENMIRELFDEVLVTTQESLLNNREQTIQTICNFIGVEVPIYENKKRNVSQKAYQLNTRRIINKFTKSVFNKKAPIITDVIIKIALLIWTINKE